MIDIQQFIDEGAVLTTSVAEMRRRMGGIRAFVFDWDGVFNKGEKFGDSGSPFAEPDSMGTNLLRLGYWLGHDRRMPVAAVITGARNEGVDYFIYREHFDMCLRGFHNKREAWSILLNAFDLQPSEVAFAFDDVLDLVIAEECGLRFCIRRNASPAFSRYVVLNGLCDYLSASAGGDGAVREICELMLTLTGMYDKAVEARVNFDPAVYANYLAARSSITPRIVTPETDPLSRGS